MTKTEIAKEDDILPICGLLELLFLQEADFSPDREKQAVVVRDIIQHPEKGHFLLIKQAGSVQAVVSLIYLPSTAMGGKVALLEDMVVAPASRGQGLGKQLLTDAIAFARQQGCLRITLLTDCDNLPAQRFYQQQGFAKSAMLPMRLLFNSDKR